MNVDLNCDMGEGMPNDATIMPYISSANIACGYHAGDEGTIRATVDLCLQHGVAIGAHPSFDDKPNFGRIPVELSSVELYHLVLRQLEIMKRICNEKNATLHHVKPHGAMYNMAAKDESISATIARAVKDFDAALVYYGLSGSVMISEAQSIGLRTANEVFADRSYQPDGSLTPRSQPNALITDVDASVAQVVQMLIDRTVTAVDGTSFSILADTICIHGDGPHALEFARAIHRGLAEKQITIAAT